MTSGNTQPGVSVKTIVEFCRFARREGLPASVQVTLAALDAASVLGTAPWEDLKSGLRSAVCSSKEDWDLFEDCFEAFWRGLRLEPSTNRKPHPRGTSHSRLSSPNMHSLTATGFSDGVSTEHGGALAVAGASTHDRLTTADFSSLPEADMAALELLSLRLFKQMSRRLSRRLRTGSSRGQVDLRKTIRRNICHGGEPMNLQYRERKPRPHRLMMLLDISGSMSPYSFFLLKFLYVLQKQFCRVDTYLFSTDLVEITHLFRGRRLEDALHALSQLPAGWSGGTSIGGSLRKFNQLHRIKLRSSDTLFVVLSDGWDTGDPNLLAAELSAVRKRVRRVIWLNPLLGLKDYQPITAGMSAALPHVDVFAPAHNLESLLSLEKHL